MERHIKAIVIDDERLARRELSQMLKQCGVEVIGEADSVETAIVLLGNCNPDVVFLDIQMPGGSGFDLLHRTDKKFKTVFVTAFDQFAVRAFEVNALDYLLKPVNPVRLSEAIRRIEKEEPPMKGLPKWDYDDRLLMHKDGCSFFVKIQSIVVIQSADDYTSVHTADGVFSLCARSLKEWEDRLPSKHFLRIHRGAIVNLDAVERMEKWFNYSTRLYVRHYPEPVIVSRRYASRLKKKLS